MRVLHFMNSPLTIDQVLSEGNRVTTSGGWIAALLSRLSSDTDIVLACASLAPTRRSLASTTGRVDCFEIPGRRNRLTESTDRSLKRCRDLVEEWKPDLIHVHGTEECYGLLTARGLVRCPSVVSLQGLLGPCSEWHHYFGNRGPMDVIRIHRWLEIPAMRGQWMEFWKIARAARRESEIIAGNRFFIGRTEWDKAYIAARNPSAHYFHGGELLRGAFWQTRWDLGSAKRHSIIFTNAGHPRKGTETLLEAAKLLKASFPDIQVRVAGWISRRSGYGRYIRRRIGELGNSAVDLGHLDAEQMARELSRSHVFVSPSYIENSSNALCEAQLIGVPVISSYTGGIPSLVAHGDTGLFFPPGDAPMLAARLRELFEDDELAVRLGTQAHGVAVRRHDPKAVVNDTVATYKHVLQRCA